MQECKRDLLDNLLEESGFTYTQQSRVGGEEVKQGEMEVVCLSQTYQVALCCLLHHDLRPYCALYNGCNAVVYSHTKESATFVH